MGGSDILCGIWKNIFKIPYQISQPHIERYLVYWEGNVLEPLDLQAPRFWNAPTTHHPCMFEIYFNSTAHTVNSLMQNETISIFGLCNQDSNEIIIFVIEKQEILPNFRCHP